VDFVRTRLLDGAQSLEQIIMDVMKRCLADDPRKSQGIGGDNMTFMIVQIRPCLSRGSVVEA
jgi:protein phosphatase 1G